MQDMPTTMSKFLAMGMPLREVVLRSTWNPAQIIQRAELGHLTTGAAADIAVWKLMEGDFGFGDASGGKLSGRQRLICELTLRDGKVAWDWNSRAAADYRTLGPAYGVREGVDHIVPPK
jgi:dihydroorotase